MTLPSALGAHAFDPSPDISRYDKGGKAIRLCRICGRVGRGSGHRTSGLTGEQRGSGPRSLARSMPGRGPRAASPEPQPAPRLPAAPQKRRGSARVAARELLVLAAAIDALLELPTDSVGWRLRLRLADIRPILGVEPTATLRYDPSAQPEPEPPSDHLLRLRPEMAPAIVESPRAASLAILTGIRNDRVKLLARRAIEDGWEASMTAGGHLALSKGGQRVIGSSTTNGNGRAWANFRAEAKRHGIDVGGL